MLTNINHSVLHHPSEHNLGAQIFYCSCSEKKHDKWMISGQSIVSLEHCTLWIHQQQVADSIWAQVEIPTTVENASSTSDFAKRSWLLSLTRGSQGKQWVLCPINPWGQFIPLGPVIKCFIPTNRKIEPVKTLFTWPWVAHKFAFVSRCTTGWAWVESSSCFPSFPRVSEFWPMTHSPIGNSIWVGSLRYGNKMCRL